MRKTLAVAEVENWCCEKRGLVSLQEIEAAVCKEFNITKSSLLNRCRKSPFGEARRCYIWFCRRLTYASLKGMARHMNRTHAAIVKYNNRATGLLSIGDDKLSNHIFSIYTQLKNCHEEVSNQT